MKTFAKKAGALILAAGLGLASLTGCGANDAAAVLDGTKTVVTINDEEVKMGVLSLLTRYQQAQIYQIYSTYFGTTNIFDMSMDESTGETYGEKMRGDVLTDIEKMILLRQHASDYEGIELTDEEKEAIAAAAQAYIDENAEEIRTKIGATYDDAVELLSLFKIQEKMMAAIGDAVDQEVSDEEAQQTSISYVAIRKAEEDESSDASAAESADESAAEEPSVEQQNAEKKADAEAILAALKDNEDADLDEIAKEENEDYSASTGQFTTNDTSDTSLDEAIVKAAAGLSDGDIVDEVIESDDYYYVVRVNKVFDESLTETKKGEILRQRKQDSYDTLLSDWQDAASITVDETVLGTLVLSDKDVFTLLAEDPSADESAAESAESTESTESAESQAAGN